jgi:hypothetical protein
MRQNFATRKQLKEREQEEKAGGPHPPIVGLTSSYSLHDFHNFSVQVPVPFRQVQDRCRAVMWNGVVEREPQEPQLSSSRSGFGSGSNIKWNTKVKKSKMI